MNRGGIHLSAHKIKESDEAALPLPLYFFTHICLFRFNGKWLYENKTPILGSTPSEWTYASRIGEL